MGANLPWWNYGTDFGRSAWGHHGVSVPLVREKIGREFAVLSDAGVRVIRWFVFCDGRCGIRFDVAGMPAGIDDCVVSDLDAALTIAEQHEIGLNLVLLDFHWMLDKKVSAGVQGGGHAPVINDSAGQRALVERVFQPLLSRYGGHRAILAWEVMNEPEWVIVECGASQGLREASTLANFQAFTRLVADAVHRLTSSYVTLGSAKAKWVGNWMGQGLDYYQAHYWYDPRNPSRDVDLYHVPYHDLGLDAPLVVGEFPANPIHNRAADYTPPQISMTDYLDTFRAAGYAGAWLWSFRGADFGAVEVSDLKLSNRDTEIGDVGEDRQADAKDS